MRWAVINEAGIVTSIVEQDDPPAGGVKAPDGSGCAVGKVWNGWGFSGQRWATYDFLNRFTPSELSACLASSATDANILKFLTLANAAHEISSDDPVTILGMDYLVAQALLTQGRRDEILGA